MHSPAACVLCSRDHYHCPSALIRNHIPYTKEVWRASKLNIDKILIWYLANDVILRSM